MAEKSLFWFTDGFTGSIGDGAAPYTQEEFRGYNDGWASDGVIGSVLNELAPTVNTGTSPDSVDVNTGRAIVNGFPYLNDASVNVAPTQPSIGDTGMIVVLRAVFADAEIRLAITSSADGTATIPSPVQSAGVTWEVELASFVMDTSGNISSFTDTRQAVRAKASGWHLIEAKRLTADTAAPVTFANISPIFDNLRLVCMARSDAALLIDDMDLTLNNRVAGGDYDYLQGTFSNTGLATVASAGTATALPIDIVADNATSGIFSAVIIEIPSYSGLTQQKSGHASSSIKTSTVVTAIQRKEYHWWFPYAEAISEIDLDLSAGTNFKAGSEFYLYGC